MEKVKKGDIVIFYPDFDDEEAVANGVTDGLPAIVTNVVDGTRVNLRVFADSGDVLWRIDVEQAEEKPEAGVQAVERQCWIFRD